MYLLSIELCTLVVSVIAMVTYGGTGGVLEVRGLSPEKISLYPQGQGQSFRCLDGSMVLPRTRINDDYCDCPDGTDEPGTAACPNGSFYCANDGYVPGIIPSSRVNDGICDCCDGSDEYTTRVNCPNACLELGRQLREEEERQRLLLSEGHQIFKELAQEGASAISAKRTRLEELEQEKVEVEELKSVAEKKKQEMEEPETEAKNSHKAAWESEKEKRKQEKRLVNARTAFTELDTNSDGLVSIAEIQAHKEFDIDTNGEVSYDEAKEYLEEHEDIQLNDFLEKVWDNIHQIFVSAAAKQQAEEVKEEEKPVPPEEEDEERNHDEEDDEDDDDDEIDETTPSDKVNKEDKKNDDDDDFPMSDYDEKTKELIEAADAARREFNSLDEKFRNIDRDVSDIKKLLEMDLGQDSEFYSLKDKCFDFSDREYTYTLCPFEKATQRSKSGGGETSLGRWGSWTGPSDNKYSSMLYDHGQNCWNGPDRSATIHVECGLNNELVSASEPNRCEYHFTFRTPAACSQSVAETTTSQHPQHAEL